ncbi:13651_t:CDS:2 [Acaulospora morrowiae]|uniref:13651_t:CDS:1 n=1 Tax=Acaulospora morrowiae TaxID=94023 RepID=A0A9N9DWB1_9GLOM|nr:13651_t:CDS:2 [Acaulospora morrowiae]
MPNCDGLDNHSCAIDYTTSLENNNNGIRTKDNFIFTSFVEPMRVRPQTPIRNVSANSEVEASEESDNSKMKNFSDNKKHTPRPPNAFILYRRAKQSEVTADKGNISNAMISKILSRLWKNENEEKRRKSDSIESNLSARKTITPTPTATLISPQIPSPTPPQSTEIYHNTTTVEELPLNNDFLWNSYGPQYDGTIPIPISTISTQYDEMSMQNIYENFPINYFTDETYPFYYQPYDDMPGSYI